MPTSQDSSETAALLPIERQQHAAHRFCMLPAVRVGLLIFVWFTLGTILNFYNKVLVGRDSVVFGHKPFPAPLFMSGVQFAMQHMLARLMFQSGVIQRTADKLSWRDWLTIIGPNGACTGLDIGFSNMSLVFITISFYTMCKATVPLYLLFFAFLFGTERPSWRLGLVVLVISCGLVLLVSGEVMFDAAGFALVMVAACLSGLRFTLTQIFLHGFHDTAALGGPLEFLEALTPVMSTVVLVISLIWERLWVTLPSSPFFESAHRTGLTFALIFAGAVVAFLLVWTEYKVIKETSALTFMIAGSCKEVLTVLAAVMFMGDPFGWVNAVGLTVVLLGVGLFKLHKLEKSNKKDAVVKTIGGRASQEGDADAFHETNGSTGVDNAVELGMLTSSDSTHLSKLSKANGEGSGV